MKKTTDDVKNMREPNVVEKRVTTSTAGKRCLNGFEMAGKQPRRLYSKQSLVLFP